MDSVRDVYNIIQKHTNYGIEGYHVDKKYVDPIKIKQQRKSLQQSLHKPKYIPPKQLQSKHTYLDQIQKNASQFPSPSTYILHHQDISQLTKKSQAYSVRTFPKRKTIFQQIQQKFLKDGFPAGANYNLQQDKKNNKSYIGKAQNSNFIENLMRNSLQIPGAGQYNLKDDRVKWIGHSVNWKPSQKSKIRKQKQKLPSVGSYTPRPVQYKLFQQYERKQKSKSKVQNGFGKQQRWRMDQKNTFGGEYNILSQWGIKKKYIKKDILEKISRPSRGSVYH